MECHPHERGHIHDTFISTWGSGEKVRRSLHQRMNETVFRDIPALMHNIERISRHMLEKQGAADSLDGFHVLDLVPTREGKSYLPTSSGPWRTYHYIENSTSYDVCSSEERAFEAARAFGWFQAQLVDLKAGELKETLPRFFSPPHRLTQFDKALAGDVAGRAGSCVAEIRFIEDRRNTVRVLQEELEAGSMPTRIVHGDTKLNNILFDNTTGVAKSIVDLDTCMPAWSLYDFGDLVPTREGNSYLSTSSGPWRTYHYIENSTSYDVCSSEDRAFEAARAFGWFQAQLVDLEAGELKETLPRFFSPPHRLAQFDEALAGDATGRAGSCVAEIRFVEDRRNTVRVVEDELEAGSMPTRIVHGDTKLNNILFDNTTGVAKSIVDLDTCMPAWSLYDFGDLVRFTAATSREDEKDLEKVGTDFRLYRALVNGYLEKAREFLTPREIELMPYAARLVTFTIGLRFLTDYLNGDVYFKTERTAQNLDRARVQFKMVEGMEQREEDMVVH